MQQALAAHRIELAEDIVEEQERINAALLLYEFVAGESQRERERALLSLGRLTSSVAAIERDRDVVALWPHRCVAPKSIVVEGLLERVVEISRPRLFIGNADSLLVLRE
jgi:hypothetical protein